MFFTEKDCASRKTFIKTLKNELDYLVKRKAQYFNTLKRTEDQIHGIREILIALQDAETLQKEIKK